MKRFSIIEMGFYSLEKIKRINKLLALGMILSAFFYSNIFLYVIINSYFMETLPSLQKRNIDNTLGTNQIFRGLAYVISNGEPVLNIQGQFRKTFQLQIVCGVRMNRIYLLILAVIFAVILSKRRAGVYIYAIGVNESAAKMSGINVNRYKMIAYIMCSIGAAMAGTEV